MNLGQIATAVGQRLGVDTSSPNTRDGAAVRSFLQIRHDQLFRAFLWKDSVIDFVLPVNQPYAVNSNYLPTKGRVILPGIFQHVLAVRLGWRGLKVQRPMLYYRAHYGERTDNDIYTAEFFLMSACVWEFDTPQNSILQTVNVGTVVSDDVGVIVADDTGIITANDASQNQVPCVIDTLDADEVSIVRSNISSTGAGAQVPLTDRIDNLTKTDQANSVVLAVGNVPVAVMQPADTYCQKRQRIQLVGKPLNTAQQQWPLHILGKRKTPPFTAESDFPSVNGMDGVLFALAYYDFKQRDEAGGSADATTALNEAVGPRFLSDGKPGGFLGKLIEEEVIQEAYNARIIPDQGFGGDGYYDEPAGSKTDPYCY